MSSNSIITIQDLLQGRGRNKEFDDADPKSIKIVRHSGEVKEDSCIYKGEFIDMNINELYWNHHNKFLEWQCEQKDSDMKGVKFWVVFLAEEHCECRFIGVFEIGKSQYITTNNNGKTISNYDMHKIDGFEILEEKVIIDWGKSTRGFWHNWTTKKEVVRIEQKVNNNVPIFTRYEDVILTYEELQNVVQDPNWCSKLECLNCVYVIVDKNNGMKYVGVTYKDTNTGMKSGILSRWTEYADNGHGGNVNLKEIIDNNGIKYAEKYFQWSILETLPLNVPAKVAIKRESLYKKKLDTIKHGYNEN